MASNMDGFLDLLQRDPLFLARRFKHLTQLGHSTSPRLIVNGQRSIVYPIRTNQLTADY
jgi:hypothetical protein